MEDVKTGDLESFRASLKMQIWERGIGKDLRLDTILPNWLRVTEIHKARRAHG